MLFSVLVRVCFSDWFFDFIFLYREYKSCWNWDYYNIYLFPVFSLLLGWCADCGKGCPKIQALDFVSSIFYFCLSSLIFTFCFLCLEFLQFEIISLGVRSQTNKAFSHAYFYLLSIHLELNDKVWIPWKMSINAVSCQSLIIPCNSLRRPPW